MYKIASFLIVLFFFVLQINAQEQTKNLSETGFFDYYAIEGGNVKITQDVRLETLINNHITANKKRPIKGWRVQIFFGQGQAAKYKAENIKKSFLKKYPETSAYLIYEAPYFKVRVGNYKKKFEAAKMKKELESKYDKIFLIEDEIKLFDNGEDDEEDTEDVE